MGFADSGTIVSIANAADIATAIGADPTGQAARLVDNKQSQFAASPSAAGLNGGGQVALLTQVDVSAGVMVLAHLSSQLSVGSTATCFDLQFDWWDPTGTVILWSETFEMLTFVGVTGYFWESILPARGALLTVTALNANGTVLGGTIAITVNTSSRVVPAALRSSTAPAFDGILLTAAGSVLASGTATVLCSPACGRVSVAILGATTQLQTDFAWGVGRAGLIRDITTWPATGASSKIFEFPATNRPLSIKITNLSTTTTGQYNVTAWTNPEGS